METASQPTGIITIQPSKDTALKAVIWAKGGSAVHDVVVTGVVARVEPFTCAGPVGAGADVNAGTAAGGERVGYGEGETCEGEG